MTNRNQKTSIPTILLLGSHHLANNNYDRYNVQFDDMFSLHRQQEIAHCVELLKRFQPTKVAVEILSERSEKLNEDYQNYRSGTFTLTSSEFHQLGFRTAAAIGHDRIYAIDWNESIDWDLAFTYAQEHQPVLFDKMFEP